MEVTPYLFFNGTCEAAMTFYAQTLGAEVPQFMKLADMPPEDQANMAGAPKDAVMNCMLVHKGGAILASDDSSGDAAPMAGCSIHLGLDTVEEAHRVFGLFAEGGEVTMPIGPMFWTAAFGMLTDKFGTRWMISVSENAET